jgi:hypothetical protein
MPNTRSKKSTSELWASIEQAIAARRYFFTRHAFERSIDRKNVNMLQVLDILTSDHKYHESSKDRYNPTFQSWNYAVLGRTIDDERVRIILSFDENDMLIITVINLDDEDT